MKHFLITLIFAAILFLGHMPGYGEPSATSYPVAEVSGRSLREESVSSKLIGRSMPYRVLLPVGYESVENKEKSFAVLYLLHGLTGSFKDWSDKTKIADFAAGSSLIIVMPDGANGWYTDSALKPEEKYESYIVTELIPDVEDKFRAGKERNSRMIAGLSMGGYGALKFGVKYPDLFVLAGSFSGALRAPEWDPEQLKAFPAASVSIKDAFGPPDSAVRKENDIYAAIKNLDEKTKIKMPFFYIDCGTEDFLLAQSQDFARLLLEVKLPHEFRQLPGNHDWKFWNAQIEQFLFLAKRFEKPFGAMQTKVGI